MGLRVWALVACFTVGGAGTAAAAACTQVDLRGVWDAYVTDNDGVGVSWTTCVLRIAANGTLQPGTRCANADGEQATINSGRLALLTSCGASGSVTLRVGTELRQSRVRQATLARDKNLLVGVGRDPYGEPFTFQAVKR